ncbi:hypothetical protein ARMGADRAFT_1082580 [Armillaria gallica]|uniref:Peptidase C14 caspase domain-containing protein n=1 Tax=Armillaria gallica TaxID=47427 RepID=A0A2H3D6H8_ARMGA|nr:hypothetical protein ARMGADRAFT_1082580 [Armillaria gallica]
MAHICRYLLPALSWVRGQIEQDLHVLQELESDMDGIVHDLRETEPKTRCNCAAHPTLTSTALPNTHPESEMRERQDGFSRETTLREADPWPLLDPSRIYAVLIGIDGYSTYPLRGCVADAVEMKKYLVEYLHVPNERSQGFLGPVPYGDTSTDVSSLSPSRANILSVLLSLITNLDIKYGDPIIIFFAGHGSRYLLSSQDGPDDDKALSPPKFVEAFCPMDRDSRDSNGVPVPDISDRELNTILSQIFNEKGSRITCILDCCHAGSITRMLNSNVRTSTALEDTSLEQMLLTAEQNLKNLPGYRSVLAKDWYPDRDSHVVLAACKSELAKMEQIRKEDGTMEWRGVFTSQLIDTLKSDGWREEATYEDLIEAMAPVESQTSCVSGERKNKRLWYQY